MKTLVLLLSVILLPIRASAGPYFRLADPLHMHKSVGAYIDPLDASNTSAGTATALVTHSVSDGGCLFPELVCEDWSPLTVGFSVKAGRLDFNVGPAVNLTPWLKAGIRAALDRTTKDETLSGLKSALSSEPISGNSASIALGPTLAVAPVQNGGILSPEKWQGKLRIFAGASWSFK